jgi:hypothetical protein
MKSQGSFKKHYSEVRHGEPQIEILVVYPDDPDDNLTDTLCIVEGHGEESGKKAGLILTALQAYARQQPNSIPKAAVLSNKSALALAERADQIKKGD